MLAKMLPPFMFSCDFTHQLGRESSRKPLKPTFWILVQMLSGRLGLQTLPLSLGRCRWL